MAIPGNLLSPTTESIDPNTSGWKAALNCALSLGSGGRNGDGLLLLTSVASGEMQAQTVATYPVTAGVVYQVFADAASSTQAERIGIVWYDATNTALSTTWSLTTDAASASLHRISVAGVAPATAVTARVVLSATVAAAGRLHYFENVYLGMPFRTSGNLFDFNTESADIDATGWAVDTNAAITLDVPVWQWSVAWYHTGGEQIRMTASANGNASIRTAATPTVTPGVEYIAYGYLNPPTSGASCWIEIRWYTSGGTLISTKRAVLAQPGTGIYQQRVSGIAPATAATAAVAVGITSATAGQALRVEGVVMQPLAPLYINPGTVMPYEDTSFEQGVGQWTVASGVATIARSTPWTAATLAGFDGAYHLLVSSATATTSVLASGHYPVTPGLSWRPTINVQAVGGTWQVAVNLAWYTSGGTLISTTTTATDPIPADGTVWTDWADYLAPPTAATAQIRVTVVAPAVSTTMLMDVVTLVQTLPSTQVTADDDRGCMELVIRDLTAGATITLWRIVGGQQSLVRGASGLLQRAALSGTQLLLDDYEAPIGVPVTYRAEFYSTAGVGAGTFGFPSATLSVPAPSDCWIKDPIEPYRNVMLRASAAPDWARPAQSTEFRIRQRRNSVFLYDVRGGLTGTLQVWTLTDAERAALHFAVDTGNPLLLQFSPGLGIEDVYVSVGDTTEARAVPYGGEPRRLWSLPLTQVDQPIGGVVGTSGWTVRDLATEIDTVLDVVHTYATVLDLALNNRGA